MLLTSSQGHASRVRSSLNGISRFLLLFIRFLSVFRLTGILEKHRIGYYVGFGTLLGLVRNDRIIPWTRDNDVSLIEDGMRFVIKISLLMNCLRHKHAA